MQEERSQLCGPSLLTHVSHHLAILQPAFPAAGGMDLHLMESELSSTFIFSALANMSGVFPIKAYGCDLYCV